MLSQKKFILTIPTRLNFIVGRLKPKTKTCYIYIYNENLYMFIFLKNSSLLIDNTTGNIIAYSYFTSSFSKNFINQFNFLMKSLFTYFFRKIKYTGKSFKIERLTSFLFDFKFGHSIKSYIALKNKLIKQVKKSNFYYWFCNITKTNIQLNKIIFLRKWNQYTQRGLKLNKTLIYKQQGKKSTYV